MEWHRRVRVRLIVKAITKVAAGMAAGMAVLNRLGTMAQGPDPAGRPEAPGCARQRPAAPDPAPTLARCPPTRAGHPHRLNRLNRLHRLYRPHSPALPPLP